MAGKRITKSVESLKEVVGLVDSLGTSVDFLEERLRGVFVQLSNMGQLPPINFNKTTQGGQSAAPQFTAVQTPSTPIPPALSYLGVAPHEPSQTRYNHVSPNFSFPPSVVHPNASMSSVFGPEISPAMRDVRSREGERKQNAVAAPDPDQNLGSPFAKNKTEDLRRTFGTLNDTLIGTNNTLSRLATSLEDFTKGQKSKGSDPVKEQTIAEERKPRQNLPKEENPYRDEGKEFSIFDKKAIFGALGAVSAAVSTYFKTEVATRSIGVGSQRIGEMARFGIAGSMQERALDSAMATDAGSLLRYQGDILLPGQTKYLGRGGFNNALEVSGRETNDRLELEKAKHSGSVSSSFTNGVMATGLGIIGGVALGMAAPGALAVGAVAGLGTLANGLLGASNDTYSQLTDGGLASSFMGPLIYGGRDNAKRVAADNKSRARSQLEQETYENALGLQEAELKANKQNEVAYSTYLQSVKSRKANTTLIGGYSIGAYSSLPFGVEEQYASAINGNHRFSDTPTEETKLKLDGPFAAGQNGQFFNYLSPKSKSGANIWGRSSPFGPDRINPKTGVGKEFHNGTDYAAPAGTDVPSFVAGKVIHSGHSKTLTNSVMIQDDHGGVATVGHLDKNFLPKVGERIELGQIIGKVGKYDPKDPHSSGEHIHVKYKNRSGVLVDPETLINPNTMEQIATSRKKEADKALTPISTVDITDIHKKYNLDMEQLYNYRARVLNVVNPDSVEAKNISRTTGLLDLQQAGLGSFDTLVGNLGGLNQARGTNDNTSALREIMTSAVAAGFDRSRSAQQFVESVVDLSGRLGVTDTDSLSKSLSLSSKLMSADITSDRADEKGLSKAKSAMESLASATSESDGLMGAVKAAVLTRRGVKLNSGAHIYATMSSAQISSMINTLEDKKGVNSIKDVNNFDAEALLQVAEGKTFQEKRQWVVDNLKQLRTSIGSVQNAAATSVGDKAKPVDKLFAEIKDKPLQEQYEAIRAEAQKHAVSGSVNGRMNPDAAAQQYIESFTSRLDMSKPGQKSLEDLIKSGNAAYTNKIDESVSASVDSMGRTGSARATSPMTVSGMRGLVAKGYNLNVPGLGLISGVADFDEKSKTTVGKKSLEEYGKRGVASIAAEAKAFSRFGPDSPVKIDDGSIRSLANEIVKALKGQPTGNGKSIIGK
ncbi:Peptidase M23 [uncultured Caudovirales phage]|uniref:Peptidase M23 n=1 Tax=uncultured Caudovirales phage TaxID=2100421 RepID=A0A6J7WXB4_9CAUD|nr:Peptidase M23 [uncultured Caudovirales phage]